MKTIQRLVVFACAAVLLAACTPPAANTPANANTNTGNANANVAAKTAMPSVETLSALEAKAFEAFKTHDTKFWDGFLADNFVSLGPDGKRAGKAEVIKMISDDKCEYKSDSVSDQHVTPIGADAAVITLKQTADYTCNGKAGPSPVMTASLYERVGSEWKAGYHSEVPITDPKNMKPGEKKAEAPANKAAESPAAAATADALTDSLMALEKSGWEAWKARDAKKLSDLTASDLAFVNEMGMFTSSKDATIKSWTEPKCEIKSVNLSDGKATMITKDAAILTFKGVADGTCEGNPVGTVWATSIYVKDGDTWKLVYGFENPA